MDETKIIVTHWSALAAKYGARVSRVKKAVDALIAADAGRGIASRLVALDDRDDMAPFGAPPMAGAADRKGAKDAVDAIDRTLRPHYILILGAWDVVPMQLLENEMGSLDHSISGDPDLFVPSDLPYACDAPYSPKPVDFLGPTRVVGRLPDIPFARTPGYLVKLLENAAQARSRPPEDYGRWLGLCAETWKNSSTLTARRVFGDAASLLVSPPHRNQWSRRKLSPRVHFINCHGGDLLDAFYGEARKKGEGMPIALSSKRLEDMISPGTVVAAEGCFGGALAGTREQGVKHPGRLGMALQYLGEGACGYFGSTTTAYGLGRGNGWADVICRHFLRRVLKGASLGRAALMARHDYFGDRKLYDPIQVKTLAQFCLLGDPSIHPVATRSGRRILPRPTVDQRNLERQRRNRRREELRRTGEAVTAARLYMKSTDEVPGSVIEDILAYARPLGLEGKVMRLFTLGAGALAHGQGDESPGAAASASQVAVLVKQLEEEPGAIPRYAAILAQVQGSKVVPGSFRVAESR